MSLRSPTAAALISCISTSCRRLAPRTVRTFSSTASRRIIIPVVFEETPRGERGTDLFSRLLKERVLFVGDVVEESANLINSQLLWLEASDSQKPIQMYINSHGGNVTDILAVYDTMTFIKPPVHTVCMGHASSLSSLLLAAGQKGHRIILPNARVMMHQPSGGRKGQQSDIAIAAKETLRQRDLLESLYQRHCALPGESVEDGKTRFRKALERDYYLSPEEAVAFGIVDRVQGPMGKVGGEGGEAGEGGERKREGA